MKEEKNEALLLGVINLPLRNTSVISDSSTVRGRGGSFSEPQPLRIGASVNARVSGRVPGRRSGRRRRRSILCAIEGLR